MKRTLAWLLVCGLLAGYGAYEYWDTITTTIRWQAEANSAGVDQEWVTEPAWYVAWSCWLGNIWSVLSTLAGSVGALSGAAVKLFKFIVASRRRMRKGHDIETNTATEIH